jgi:hypothetical protein
LKFTVKNNQTDPGPWVSFSFFFLSSWDGMTPMLFEFFNAYCKNESNESNEHIWFKWTRGSKLSEIAIPKNSSKTNKILENLQFSIGVSLTRFFKNWYFGSKKYHILKKKIAWGRVSRLSYHNLFHIYVIEFFVSALHEFL